MGQRLALGYVELGRCLGGCARHGNRQYSVGLADKNLSQNPTVCLLGISRPSNRRGLDLVFCHARSRSPTRGINIVLLPLRASVILPRGIVALRPVTDASNPVSINAWSPRPPWDDCLRLRPLCPVPFSKFHIEKFMGLLFYFCNLGPLAKSSEFRPDPRNPIHGLRAPENIPPNGICSFHPVLLEEVGDLYCELESPRLDY